MEVDQGAYEALIEGNSLFPRGIKSCSGPFFKGDCVDLIFEGKSFGVGISEYDQSDVDKIINKHSDEIEATLGFKTSSSVIQSENLALIEDGKNE